MIGRIIGKKGAQVRQISDLSGARLIINRDARFPLHSALTPMARSASADTNDSSGGGSYLDMSQEDLPGLRARTAGLGAGHLLPQAGGGGGSSSSQGDSGSTTPVPPPTAPADATVLTIVGRLEATLMAQQYIRELVHYHHVPTAALGNLGPAIGP
jgi:hypothetical protein